MRHQGPLRCKMPATVAKSLAPPFVTDSKISSAVISRVQVTKPLWDCQLAGRLDAAQIESVMHPLFATRANLDLLEENYQRWQEDPESLDPSWLAFFEGFELGDLQLRNGATVMAGGPARHPEPPPPTRIDGLVYSYPTPGHPIARGDPPAGKHPEEPLLCFFGVRLYQEEL